MKTSKPCSTISYNSEQFLTVKLNDLLKRRVISFWLFVEHLPEEDEKKKHKHLYIIPNGQTNTDQIQDFLEELNPDDIEHPFGCIFFKSSKFDDFYFYGLHDPLYLASKGQTRKYHYKDEDFKMSDLDYFTSLKHEIDYSKLGNRKTVEIAQEIKDGASLEDLLLQGRISAQNALQWKAIYDMLNGYGSLYRSGRSTHTPLVNNDTINLETGEIEQDQGLIVAFEKAINEPKS